MWFIYFPELDTVKDLPFYTVSVGLHRCQYPTDRPAGYEYPQFLYSSQGRGILTTEGRTIEIPPKSIIFLPAHVPHSYHALTDNWDIRWFVPSGYETEKLLARLGFNQARIFPIISLSSLEEIHNKIHMAFQINTKESLFFSASYTYEFLFEFYKQYIHSSTAIGAQYRKRLTPLIDYIEHNLTETITQQQLCDEIHVSPQHLCRMFKECFDTRPMEYIARARIQRACELLISTSVAIEPICYEVGFNNTNYFCKIFKRYTNMTPGQYRIANGLPN